MLSECSITDPLLAVLEDHASQGLKIVSSRFIYAPEGQTECLGRIIMVETRLH